MPRPAVYTDATVVAVSAKEASHKLQANSDRRAIVNYLVDSGGRATLKEIDEHFGFDIRKTVLALARAGWLEIAE